MMEETYGALKERLIAVLVKDSQAWERLARRLQMVITRTWTQGYREAAARALRLLEATPAETFDESRDGARILSEFEAEVGPAALPRLLDGPVVTLSEAIWRVGGQEAARAAGIDYRFDLPDRAALELAQRGDLYWIGRSWDAFTRKRLSDAVTEYFERGMTYAQMAEALREAFSGIEEKGQRYWELAADAMATKTREMGRIGGYAQAGIEYVQIRARMDERTTAICRSLHGRVIAVSRMMGQRAAYLDAVAAGRMDAAMSAWPMLPDGTDFSGTPTVKLPDNVGLPPYHFRCRTRTVAYLGRVDAQGLPADGGDGSPVAAWRAATWQREQLEARQLAEIVKRAMQARWENQNLQRHLKHAHDGIEEYNARAIDLVRRGGRDIALSISHDGDLMALFFTPFGKGRMRVTVVNVSRQTLVTHHIRRTLDSSAYAMTPVVQTRGREVRKRWGLLA